MCWASSPTVTTTPQPGWGQRTRIIFTIAATAGIAVTLWEEECKNKVNERHQHGDDADRSSTGWPQVGQRARCSVRQPRHSVCPQGAREIGSSTCSRQHGQRHSCSSGSGWSAGYSRGTRRDRRAVGSGSAGVSGGFWQGSSMNDEGWFSLGFFLGRRSQALDAIRLVVRGALLLFRQCPFPEWQRESALPFSPSKSGFRGSFFSFFQKS